MGLSPWAGIQHLSALLCPPEGLGDKCQGPRIGKEISASGPRIGKEISASGLWFVILKGLLFHFDGLWNSYDLIYTILIPTL